MKWTPELDAVLIDLRINHRLSTPLIADRMGLTTGSVVGRLDRLKIRAPEGMAHGLVKKWTAEMVDRVRTLRASGSSSREIAAEMKVSRHAVNSVVKREKIPYAAPAPKVRVRDARTSIDRAKMSVTIVPGCVGMDGRTWPSAPLESRRGCAFPLTGSPMLYCNGKVEPAELYCVVCRRIMYTPRATVAQKREANRGIMWAAR